MMRAPTPWQDKLPSIAGTLGIQAGVAALLLFSITAARRVQPEAEAIFILPRPKPDPMVIDARQPPEEEKAHAYAGLIPGPISQLPPYALPAQTLTGRRQFEGSALLRALVESFSACRKKEGEDLPACPGITPPDPRIVKFEDKAVKGSETWQAEIDLRNAPLALPGAASGPLGVLITALTNPAAYSDPRAYRYVAPGATPGSGADQLARQRYHPPQISLGGTSFENQVRRAGAAATGHE